MPVLGANAAAELTARAQMMAENFMVDVVDLD
jgi:hypothetical protein